MQVGKCFKLSKGNVKIANRQYNTCTFDCRKVAGFFSANFWSTLEILIPQDFSSFKTKETWKTSFRLKLADWGKHRYELVFDKLAQAWDDVVTSRGLVPCCLKRHLRPLARWMKLKMTRRLGMSSLSLKMEISTSIFYLPSLFVKVCDRKSALRAAPRFFQSWDHWNIGMKRCLRWRVKHCAWPQFSIPPSRCFHVFPAQIGPLWRFFCIWTKAMQCWHLWHHHLLWTAHCLWIQQVKSPAWMTGLMIYDSQISVFASETPKDLTCWYHFSWILRVESSQANRFIVLTEAGMLYSFPQHTFSLANVSVTYTLLHTEDTFSRIVSLPTTHLWMCLPNTCDCICIFMFSPMPLCNSRHIIPSITYIRFNLRHTIYHLS